MSTRSPTSTTAVAAAPPSPPAGYVTRLPDCVFEPGFGRTVAQETEDDGRHPPEHIEAVSQRAGGAAPRGYALGEVERATEPDGQCGAKAYGQNGERGHDHRTDAASASGI